MLFICVYFAAQPPFEALTTVVAPKWKVIHVGLHVFFKIIDFGANFVTDAILNFP